MQQHIKNHGKLFVNNIPLMDVRAPIEFNRGAFPNSKNLPIMDDQQREIVGICYKSHGQKQAIEKGHKLIQGKIREKRIASWVEFTKQNPNGYLYCFRGGLRSQIAQQWLHDVGIDFPLVKGGYKSLRNFLLNELEIAAQQCSFQLVGGKTGSGKTILIKNLINSVDLEAAAHHRGSSFGKHAKQQNNQINFENILATDFLKLRHQNFQNLVLEDEARTIGRVGIPKTLFEKMRKSPIIVIEEPYEARIERLLNEYVVEMHNEFVHIENEKNGFVSFSNYLLDSLEKIQKRLGPARYGGVRKTMQSALISQAKSGAVNQHRDWLSAILDNYYDPMYEDQLNKRKKFICFRGNYDDCHDYLSHSF